MDEPRLRTQTRRFYRFAMSCLVSVLGQSDITESAIVFAPHPDDETLGCGGTIIKKRRMGADVKIVFMTDGSYVPHHLMSADGLRSVLSGEALAASRLLGVEEGDVVFLGFEDRKLDGNLDAAIGRVVEILSQQRFQEVFVPYRLDGRHNSDHLAANRVVVSALQVLGQRATVYEYPIWFWWRFWPWTGRCTPERLKTLRFWRTSLALGWSLLRDFRRSVYIGDVLDLKRAALDEYKSQMTRLAPDPRWPVLSDVSDGEFLERFLQDYELFYRYSFPH
jgi:LmbE family N-acetylglucosaminyl deacetylase